jgi:hypothetical protein
VTFVETAAIVFLLAGSLNAANTFGISPYSQI